MTEAEARRVAYREVRRVGLTKEQARRFLRERMRPGRMTQSRERLLFQAWAAAAYYRADLQDGKVAP